MAKVTGKAIEKMRLTEISIVDRPANSEARFTITKFDNGGGEHKMSFADKLAELKDGIAKVLDGFKDLGDGEEPVNKGEGTEGDNKPGEGNTDTKTIVQKADMTPVVDAITKFQGDIMSFLEPVTKALDTIPEGTEELIKFVSDNKDTIQKYVDNQEQIDALIQKAQDIDSIPDINKRLGDMESLRGVRQSGGSEEIHKSEGADWGGVLGG